jgi:hypothetical protein
MRKEEGVHGTRAPERGPGLLTRPSPWVPGAGNSPWHRWPEHAGGAVILHRLGSVTCKSRVTNGPGLAHLGSVTCKSRVTNGPGLALKGLCSGKRFRPKQTRVVSRSIKQKSKTWAVKD